MPARSRSRSTQPRTPARAARRRAEQPSHPIVELAARHLGEAYVFGARVPMANAGWRGPWDCAEFASWCVFHATGVLYGARPRDPLHAEAFTGWWAEQARADEAGVPLAVAARTPGAIVLRIPASGRTGHIAISDGHGGTIEAHSSADGVSRHLVSGRVWDLGILVPGVTYFANESAVPVAPPTGMVLRVTSPLTRGPNVRAVQAALQQKGFHPGTLDGIYGPQTASAVRAFQVANGLVADGEAGPITLAALGLAS
jgi:hypothetical protein